MRPFKFFFMTSIAIIVFFAVARVVLFALIIAAVMSLVFYGIRTLMNFFNGMRWEGQRTNSNRYLRDQDFEFRRGFSDFNLENPINRWEKERIIQIR